MRIKLFVKNVYMRKTKYIYESYEQSVLYIYNIKSQKHKFNLLRVIKIAVLKSIIVRFRRYKMVDH